MQNVKINAGVVVGKGLRIRTLGPRGFRHTGGFRDLWGGGVVLEGLTIEAGSVLVQHLAAGWLGQRDQGASRGRELSELVAPAFRDRYVQRDMARKLEDVADAVARRLGELCSHEYRGMSEQDKAAGLNEVVDTLAAADLSDAALFDADADAGRLAERVRAQQPERGRPADLGGAGAAFYAAVLAECCSCLVCLVQQRPEFLPRAQAQSLARQTALADDIGEIAAQLQTALHRLPVRSLDAPEGTAEDAEFARRYCRHLSETQDSMELFGVPVNYQPRCPLTVAYLSLRVSRHQDDERRWGPDSAANAHMMGELTHRRGRQEATVQVESALADTRLALIRGEAGSGKTTLLRWLAVHAARGTFTGPLREWSGLTPFLVKLRSHPEGPMPGPERFLESTATVLTGQMPRNWVHRRLESGRALLLVDGVDELPAGRRREVQDWLRGLIRLYPQVRIVVTSRPAAATDRWLAEEGFAPLFLEQLGPQEIAELVAHWHRAIREAPALPCTQEELPTYETRLLARLEGAAHLRTLASSPLLAAMLCALNLDRKQQLPTSRMGLYRATLDMLLQRRDTERGVPGAEAPGLEYDHKVRLLQDLAYRLTSTGRAELAKGAAVKRIAHQVERMPRMAAEAGQVLRHLVERSGVLREPAADRIDFIHRTVQEYLTALQITDDDDLDLLVEKAHLDSWRETVVMAAGHGNTPQRECLLRGILQRISKESKPRPLKLVLAACMETLPEIPTELRGSIDSCLESLVPPRDMTAARSLASAGEAVLDTMPPSLEGYSAAKAQAAVRTVWMVNGPQALEVLEGYRHDPRREVQRELAEAWKYFDPEEYALRVLADAPLEDGRIEVPSSRLVGSLHHLRHLSALECRSGGLEDLEFLRRLPPLQRLTLHDVRTDDLEPVTAHAESLSSLQLLGHAARHLEPLTRLTELDSLGLLGPPLPDLESLLHMPTLSRLALLGESLKEIEDYSPIARQDRLIVLALSECPGLAEIRDLGSRPRLRTLLLQRSRLAADLGRLAETAPALQDLSVIYSPGLSDLSPLAELDLVSLDLQGCNQIGDLTPLTRLASLRLLDLSRTKISDLSPLADLSQLESLHLLGATPGLDLSPLAQHRGLTIHLERGQDVRNRQALGPGVRVKYPR